MSMYAMTQVERYPLAYQEVREREHRARSLGAAVGNPHSLQMPGHWDPMHPDEDHRLADILAHTEDEYWGDLEGWQVCRLTSKLVHQAHPIASCLEAKARGIKSLAHVMNPRCTAMCSTP